MRNVPRAEDTIRSTLTFSMVRCVIATMVQMRYRRCSGSHGFMDSNAVGGGTGSGLGCLLLECCSVDYGKKSELFKCGIIYLTPTVVDEVRTGTHRQLLKSFRTKLLFNTSFGVSRVQMTLNPSRTSPWKSTWTRRACRP